MTSILTPIEQAAMAADFDKKASDIRKQSVDYVAAAAAFKATKEAYEGKKWNATWDMASGIVHLVREFGDPANFPHIDPVFETRGLLGPRTGDRPIASFCTLATGYPGEKMVESARGGGKLVKQWIKNRSGEKLADPCSEVVARLDDGETIADVAKFIEDYEDPVSGRKNLIGLTDAWKRRCAGDEPEAVVTSDEIATGIIHTVASTETLATMDVNDLPPGLALNRVSEVLAIIGDDGMVRFRLSPRQDLAAVSAGLSKPDGSKAALPIKQAMELFASSALLLPVGLSDLPKEEGDDPAAPGTKRLPTTRQHFLIDGEWTSALARDANPTLLMMAKPVGPGLPLPKGSFFVNASQRGRLEGQIMPLDRRELWDRVSQDVSATGVTSLVFRARENVRVKDMNLSLQVASEFGQGRREMWMWLLDEKVFKPTASFDVPVTVLPELAKSFVTKNAAKGAGRHADVSVTADSLSLSVGAGTAFTIEGKGSATAKLAVLARSLVDTLRVVLDMKPEDLTFHIDQGGALEISFTTEANAYRVFLPKAVQTDKVWVANHSGRFRRVTRDDFTA
jgi:hypothetical protein